MAEFDKISIEEIAKQLHARVETAVAPSHDLPSPGTNKKDGTVTREEIIVSTGLKIEKETGSNATIAKVELLGEAVSYKEFADKYTDLFKKVANALDTDKDGHISKAEFEKGNPEAIKELGSLAHLPLINPKLVAGVDNSKDKTMTPESNDLLNLLNSLNTDGAVGLTPAELLSGKAAKSATGIEK